MAFSWYWFVSQCHTAMNLHGQDAVKLYADGHLCDKLKIVPSSLSSCLSIHGKQAMNQ